MELNAVLGAVLLVLYGIVPTCSPHISAACMRRMGSVFILLSVMWGWGIDITAPGNYIWIFLVVAVILIGVLIYFSPRLIHFLDRIAEKRSKGDVSPNPKDKIDHENESGDL